MGPVGIAAIMAGSSILGSLFGGDKRPPQYKPAEPLFNPNQLWNNAESARAFYDTVMRRVGHEDYLAQLLGPVYGRSAANLRTNLGQINVRSQAAGLDPSSGMVEQSRQLAENDRAAMDRGAYSQAVADLEQFLTNSGLQAASGLSQLTLGARAQDIGERQSQWEANAQRASIGNRFAQALGAGTQAFGTGLGLGGFLQSMGLPQSNPIASQPGSTIGFTTPMWGELGRPNVGYAFNMPAVAGSTRR